MTRPLLPLYALGAMVLLSGCVRTVAGVVTAPVRVASKTVDWATTSQSEADEKRGRDLRHREEKLGKLQRSYDKHLRACDNGDDQACSTAQVEYEQIQELTPGVSYGRR